MRSATQIVTDFLKAWEPAFGYRTALDEYFTADCVYENVALTHSTGPAAAKALMENFNAQMGFARLSLEMVNIVVAGNIVLTERIDHLCDVDGKRLVTLRLMGVFEIRDGRIAAWRDYFDTMPFRG
ncbi:MAG: limonene-1,2-epoxide hydrolase family protein [Panacagrimonas sp.]